MTFRQSLLCLAIVLPLGCAVQPPAPASSFASTSPQIEVAFSPEAGSEALVLKVIASADRSIRLAGYSFTSPTVVRGLLDARRRGVDVAVLVDDRGNRGRANLEAMNLIASAGIPIRVISTYAIHHDKYIVADARHTETGSFNYSRAAAKANSENVLVVWNNPAVAERYLAHWADRWKQGIKVESRY